MMSIIGTSKAIRKHFELQFDSACVVRNIYISNTKKIFPSTNVNIGGLGFDNREGSIIN